MHPSPNCVSRKLPSRNSLPKNVRQGLKSNLNGVLSLPGCNPLHGLIKRLRLDLVRKCKVKAMLIKFLLFVSNLEAIQCQIKGIDLMQIKFDFMHRVSDTL